MNSKITHSFIHSFLVIEVIELDGALEDLKDQSLIRKMLWTDYHKKNQNNE